MPAAGVVATALAAVTLAAAPGPAVGADRADLKVTKGSVEAANGELTGSFVMRNGGDARAKRSKALLSVVAGGSGTRLGAIASGRCLRRQKR